MAVVPGDKGLILNKETIICFLLCISVFFFFIFKWFFLNFPSPFFFLFSKEFAKKLLRIYIPQDRKGNKIYKGRGMLNIKESTGIFLLSEKAYLN